jgi:hypothetical protein
MYTISTKGEKCIISYNFSFANELTRKINISLVEVFIVTNLCKIPMPIHSFLKWHIFPQLYEMGARITASQRVLDFLGTLKSSNLVFAKGRIQLWQYIYIVLNNFVYILRKWPLLQFFLFWLIQGMEFQLVMFSKQKEHWPKV